MVAGVVEVAAPRRTGAARTATVPVANPDVVGERTTREPGEGVGGQPATQLVAVDPGVGDLGQHPVPVAEDRVGSVAAQFVESDVQPDADLDAFAGGDPVTGPPVGVLAGRGWGRGTGCGLVGCPGLGRLGPSLGVGGGPGPGVGASLGLRPGVGAGLGPGLGRDMFDP